MAFAVFFGFVFIGLIYLYIKTRDTWNWKKISLWIGGSFIVLIVGMVIAIFAESFKSIIPTISTTISTYDDISMGDKLSDVEFKKGKLTKPPTQKSTGDELYVVNEKTAIYVDRNTNLVTGLLVGCADYQSTKFNGIGCGDSGDLILKNFKGEVSILCEPEDQKNETPARAYDVPKYGVRYLLQKNAVVGMRSFPKDFWTENKTKWIACK